jgi:diguanylate cyclase (GGDEF)-like protein
MNKLSPTYRLSLSLTMLTLSVMFTAQFFGLLPNPSQNLIESRLLVAESLTVQVSALAGRGQTPLMEHVLNEFVTRNDQVISASLRNASDAVLASAGDHAAMWKPQAAGKSTPTHTQVPIYRNDRLWGRMEVRFKSPWGAGWMGFLSDSSVGLFLFIGAVSFVLYVLLLKRALSELNPSKAVPDRVRAAFDVLAEGVLILNADEQIVLANESVATSLEVPADALIGKKASSLQWIRRKDDIDDYPWVTALNENKRVTGARMELEGKSGRSYTFMVNGAPILDSDGSVRGALATFDDMSAVERKNRELNQTLGKLEKSREKITRKNKELETLARIDPLTGCNNRRSLFEQFDEVLKASQMDGSNITCFMIDIDHFKSVNDRFGHTVGDEVIKAIAEVLRSNSRGNDIVGRYGGEEFCVISPHLTPDAEREVAERFRRAISVLGNNPNAQFPLMRITASIGYASASANVKSAMDLINYADQALYVAKESGRNRVSHSGQTNEVETSPSREGDENVVHLNTAKTDAARVESATADPSDDESKVVELAEKVRELEDLALKREDEIWHRSLHDDLSGLPNRVLLLDRARQDIKRVPRYGDVVAALCIEIETLQRVSDTLGHEAANKLVKELTRRLNDMVRQTDTVGMMATSNGSTLSRVGDNEFVILLSDIVNNDAVTQIVRRARDALAAPFDLSGEEVFFSGNFGISLFPHDASDAESLLKNASAARGHARSQGQRLNVAFYSEEVQNESTKQLRLETLLHLALDADELSLVYQPKVDLATGRICGVEALLRWKNPTLGDVSPVEFIPVAERSGLMPDLTLWVLKSICRQLKVWEPLGIDRMRIALNLSPVELRDARLAHKLLKVLKEEGASPALLEVEITETAVIDNMNVAVQTLQILKDSGLNLSIDDFGTGYSSLSHLTSLPLHVLKIDGCFVRDLDTNLSNQAIIQAIIAMAKTAGLRVLAEGVETESELEKLRELGCDEVQGYLFSKPLTPPEVTKLIISEANGPRRAWARSHGLLSRLRRRTTRHDAA